MRKSGSIRLGLLLAVSALLLACDREKPQERRCVDDDGQFVDEALCGERTPAADGGVASSATGGWDEPDGGSPSTRGGYHFIWIPYGMFGGMGTYAPGYVRSGPGGRPRRGPPRPGSVSRGGFGATGAAHAGADLGGNLMERQEREPRPDWQRRVEEVGFPIHTADGPYWDESACWNFTPGDVELLERATADLQEMVLAAVGHVLETGRYWERLSIPREMVPLIARSWEGVDGDGDPSIYGRMDLAWDGVGTPRLLEYNADTPTGLVEAAVVQWHWLQDVDPAADQWNSLHERLVEGWKELAPWLPVGPLHFACLGVPEDVLTTTYLQDTAAQGGLRTSFVEMRTIGWDDGKRAFVDADGVEMRACFKLYPWEWMARETFGPMLHRGPHPLDRAGLEDGGLEQGDPGRALGALSRPREPAARPSSSRGTSGASRASRSSPARGRTWSWCGTAR